MSEQQPASGGSSASTQSLVLQNNSKPTLVRHISRLQSLLRTLPQLQTTFDGLSPPCFTLFADIPPELRNRIWRLAAYQPRTIKLVPYNIPESTRVKGQQQHQPLLHTCREARSVGKAIYTKCLQNCCSTRSLCDETPCTKPRNIIYVNFDVDRFLYGAYEPHKGMALDYAQRRQRRELRCFNFKPKDLRRIQWLDVELYSQKVPNPITVVQRLRPFWELGVLKEYVLKLKRFEGMMEDSLNQELGDKSFVNDLQEYSKRYVLRKEPDLNLDIKIMFRFWVDKMDLAPAPPNAASQGIEVSSRLLKEKGRKRKC